MPVPPALGALPPLAALRAFEATARRRSVQDAAAELRVTPSAISHRLRTLESALGVKLFHRLNRRLVLTDAGSVYLSRVAPAFEVLRAATAEIAERRTSDSLTLTAPPSFAEIWLLPRLGRFLAAQPDIELRVEASSRAVDFAREPVDASIRYGRGDWPGLAARRLVEERLVVVCAPGLAAGPAPLAAPADLAGHTLIHSDQRLTSWTAWLRDHGQGEVRGARNLRFSQSAHSLRAAADGLGVALESRIMAADYLAGGALIEPFAGLAPADDGAAYHLVMPPGHTAMPKVRALEAWLLSEVEPPGVPASVATPGQTGPYTIEPSGRPRIRMPNSVPEPLPPVGQPASPLQRLMAGPLLVCLDFDGTLAPIVDRPDRAALPPGMADRLARLAAVVATAVVSGRDLDDLRRRVPVTGIALVGSHGLEIAHADGRDEPAPGLQRSAARLAGLVARLRQETSGLSGVLVEAKRHTVAVHWRLAGPDDAGAARRLIEATAGDYPEFGVGRGKMVAEFRPAQERDKGSAVELLRSAAGTPIPAVLYVGDDVTDEDAFRTLDASRDIGILVADPPRPSAAGWCVADTEAVATMLDDLIVARAAITP